MEDDQSINQSINRCFYFRNKAVTETQIGRAEKPTNNE